jgi:hypothetical protein
LKEPLLKKSFLTRISPFQKGKSVDFSCTCNNVLSLTYLLCNSSCHNPSSVRSLKSHLLSKHLFFSSRTSKPKPPWSFGLHIILHFVAYTSFWSREIAKKIAI